MATFHYNRFSGESANSQWSRYIQTQSYISDVGEIVSQNRKDLQATFNAASAEQKQAFQQVCGTLDDGFREVSQHLQEINCNISELRGEINAMAAMLDWKLSLMIEEQRLTNQLLGQVVQLLRIPDSQKQRAYHIEQGLKYLKNAIREGIDSTFYTDALEGFRAAERIERKDYITLNRIGQIHLYSRQHMNIPVAEEYFLKSAREAFAEANANANDSPTISPWVAEAKQFVAAGKKINAIKLVREVTGLGLQEAKDLVEFGRYPSEESTTSQHTVAMAEAYLYAARACYLQQKLPEAAAHAGNAYRLVPEFVEAGFEQAKYLAANDQDDEATAVLQTVISKDRYFAVKTLSDADLASKEPVLKLLGDFHAKAISQAKQEFSRCRDIITSGSEAHPVFEEAEHHLSQNSFLSAMKALDVLTAQRQLPYKQYQFSRPTWYVPSELLDPDYGYIYAHTDAPSHTLVEFIMAENQSTTHLQELTVQAKSVIFRNRLLWGGLIGGGIGFFVGFFKGCTLRSAGSGWPSEDLGTWFGTLIAFAIIGSIIGFLVGSATEPKIKN